MRHDTVRLLWEAGREVAAVVLVVVLTFWEYGDWERTERQSGFFYFHVPGDDRHFLPAAVSFGWGRGQLKNTHADKPRIYLLVN